MFSSLFSVDANIYLKQIVVLHCVFELVNFRFRYDVAFPTFPFLTTKSTTTITPAVTPATNNTEEDTTLTGKDIHYLSM